MHSRLTSLLCLLVVCILGCKHSAQQNARPPGFAEVARTFRAKAGRDRRVEGEAIQARLPRCPKTWEKDIGTGTLMTFDYAHPSYRLTKTELFRALGQPNDSYNDTVRYMLVHDTNDMLWEIYVDLHNDYVVGSTIIGSLKKDR